MHQAPYAYMLRYRDINYNQTKETTTHKMY